MLTDSHKQLIRSTLKGKTTDSKINAEQRSAIRQICVERMPITEPERFLRAFVDELVQAADAERIPYGVGRDAMLSQLVSIFVDELHATTDEEIRLELGRRRETPGTAHRPIVDNDSGGTRL
jgi:hypothetical protein